MKENNSREAAQDELPENKKHFLTVGVLTVFVAGALALTLSHFEPADVQGNIAPTPEQTEISEPSFGTETDNALLLLHTLYADLSGAEAFFKDAGTWSEIVSVDIDNTEYGSYVTITATTGGDSLHSYFGFFRKQNGQIAEIIWNGVTSGKFESEPAYADDKYMTATVVNTGKVPWLTRDIWKNDADNEDLILLANGDTEVILPGESGTFVYRASQNSLTPKNSTRGFLVVVDDSETTAR